MGNPKDRLLIAMPFWEGDRLQAIRLTRLIADLQKDHSSQAEILLLPRFDCTLNLDTIHYLSRKFNVHTIGNKFRRREVGWPAGCNAAAFETFDWAFNRTPNDVRPPYRAIMLLEADACPLHPGWIGDLLWAAETAFPAKIFGHHLPNGPAGFNDGHINGCCMVAGDYHTLHFLSRKLGGCTSSAGWDWALAPRLQKLGWADVPQIRSLWRKQTISDAEIEQLAGQSCAVIHGVKDNSVEKYVRGKFLV